jgi:hypothetical protein
MVFHSTNSTLHSIHRIQYSINEANEVFEWYIHKKVLSTKELGERRIISSVILRHDKCTKKNNIKEYNFQWKNEVKIFKK